MARTKLARFAENQNNPRVVEPGKPLYETIRGRWNELQFGNTNPIVLELACGRGEYTVGLSEIYPDKNFVGVDVKGDRIWAGAEIAAEKGLDNAAFLRTKIHDLEKFFAPGEVSEIWIVFPDPKPAGRDKRRRLTFPRFLNVYRNISGPGTLVRFKTDNPELFDFTLEVMEEEKLEIVDSTRDLYNSPLLAEHHGIRTRFEQMFSEKGFTINYLKFRL